MKTVKIKVADAVGPTLDWMVWNATGGAAAYPKTASGKTFLKLWRSNSAKYIHPSTDWSQGGPIIERECIATYTMPGEVGGRWRAERWGSCHQRGPTPLIAAMRCYIARKLGYVVEVPEELLGDAPKEAA